jgi:hypothetical protein
MERPDRVAAREDAQASEGLPPASEILMMQARDRRTADERVSDGIDRLTNRKFELEASIGVVLAAWDGMPDRFKADLVMVDAIAGLRELVAR